MGIRCLALLMEWFPLKDNLGIKVKDAVLDQSMDPKILKEFVQWGMFRVLRKFITNLSQAGVDRLGDTAWAYERNKIWV